MSLYLCTLVLVSLVTLTHGQLNRIGSLWPINPISPQFPTRNNVWLNPVPMMQPRQEYRTCIARSLGGDEMRITFTPEQGLSQSSPWFPNFFNNELRFTAAVTSRSLQGRFQFFLTEFGRVEDACSSTALGEVLPNQQWWTRADARGLIADPFTLIRGSRSTSSERVATISLDEMTGRAVAICPAQLLSRGTCFGPMPMCCKLGYDSDDVTRGLIPGMTNQAPGMMPSSGIINVMGMPGGTNMGSNLMGSNPLGGGATNGGLNFGNGLSTGMDTETPTNVDDNGANLGNTNDGTNTAAGSGGLGTLNFGK